MEMPFIVIDQLDDRQLNVWKRHFGDADRPRYIEEGIWRRTQEDHNAAESGWKGPQDARRRIVHYRYRYGLAATTAAPSIALQDLYLYHHVAAPAEEITEHEDTVRSHLTEGGWVRNGGPLWSRGDLRCRLTAATTHPEDVRARRLLPENYRTFDVTVTSAAYLPPPYLRQRPWEVLAGGHRIKDKRGKPTEIDDLSPLAGFLPFHVEIGCGTSVEAGIPPLHRLHEVYRVTDRHDSTFGQGHSFTLDPAYDPLLNEVLTAPEEKTAEFVEMFRACFLAEPTPALLALKELHDAGAMVGPVITNNFDVLAARAGLEECFVRRYDQRIPPVPFDNEARALLVIGDHADRRQVQARARERGMKIFYVDPEGFPTPGGGFAPYPVEGAQDDDFLCRTTAEKALPTLVNSVVNRAS